MTKPTATHGAPTPDRPWASRPSHGRALRATLLALGVWIAGTLAAPRLAEPVSAVALRLWEAAGWTSPRPDVQEPKE